MLKGPEYSKDTVALASPALRYRQIQGAGKTVDCHQCGTPNPGTAWLDSVKSPLAATLDRDPALCE